MLHRRKGEAEQTAPKRSLTGGARGKREAQAFRALKGHKSIDGGNAPRKAQGMSPVLKGSQPWAAELKTGVTPLGFDLFRFDRC